MASKKKVLNIKKIITKKDQNLVIKMTNKIHKNNFIKGIQKRNGVIVPFDIEKIANAINKAMLAGGEGSIEESLMVAKKVQTEIEEIYKENKDFIPSVENVQDIVEKQLMLSDYVKTSKNYILYREERARLRSHGISVPDRVKKLTDESKKYFRNPLSEFVYYRSYAKWIEEEGRRETWIETVDRYIAFMKGKLGSMLKESEYTEVREAILNQEAMPSMRLLQFAGNAAEKTNVCAYNCSFVAPSTLQDFGDIVYISMCGTGVGFSVESKNIQS
ncbi:MAG TPA: ATP cone domain-containing protein, partial [Candidatus Paceibacterota bacterium]